MAKAIYFVAGEVSGDNHGAALMSSLRQLDSNLQFIGRGGPQMRAIAGDHFNNWLNEAAVLGLWEVIKKYGYFRKQFEETLDEIMTVQPDAVVLIDYPGFNLRLARAFRLRFLSTPTLLLGEARARTRSRNGLGVGLRQGDAKLPVRKPNIVYYVSPQVWAWNRGRIGQMARCLDLMLCIFPFEAELYTKSGLRTEFVGHPMIDRLRPLKSEVARDPNLIGLFPGSRRREVRKIFPILMETARALRESNTNLRFEVAAASQELGVEMRAMWHRHLADEIHELEARATLEIKIGNASDLMQRASVGIVASGSATLEAAYFRMPFVLVYKVSWPTYMAARLVVNVKYLGMPNVLADKEVVPEFIQHRAQPTAIAQAVLKLMDDAAARETMISEFDSIIANLGEGGASKKAAEAIVQEISDK